MMLKPLKKIQWLAYILLPVASLFLIGASRSYRSTRTCGKVHVMLEHQGENFFLDMESVRELIGAHDLILGSRVHDIQLSQIEETMLKTKYVSKAHAWFNASGELMVRLWLNNPIARVINQSGNSFYVDAEGNVIPTSEQFTARTFLLRGEFADSNGVGNTVSDPQLRQILPVLNHLHQDSLWSANVSEILIDKRSNWTILTQVGNLRVNMGQLEEYPEKLPVLEAFTREVLVPYGWNRYRELSFQYQNQIVALKR